MYNNVITESKDVFGKPFTFSYYSGIVADIQYSKDTNVETKVTRNRRYYHRDDIDVETKVTDTHNYKVYVETPDGSEKSFTLCNTKPNFRRGSPVSVLYANYNDRSTLASIMNHQSEEHLKFNGETIAKRLGMFGFLRFTTSALLSLASLTLVLAGIGSFFGFHNIWLAFIACFIPAMWAGNKIANKHAIIERMAHTEAAPQIPALTIKKEPQADSFIVIEQQQFDSV